MNISQGLLKELQSNLNTNSCTFVKNPYLSLISKPNKRPATIPWAHSDGCGQIDKLELLVKYVGNSSIQK